MGAVPTPSLPSVSSLERPTATRPSPSAWLRGISRYRSLFRSKESCVILRPFMGLPFGHVPTMRSTSTYGSPVPLRGYPHIVSRVDSHIVTDVTICTQFGHTRDFIKVPVKLGLSIISHNLS